MALLSVADLSFVLPLTATGYIISAMLGKVFLGEDVGSNRWVGTCMIFAGVVLVGSTPERSAAAEMVKSRYTGENCLKQ
jgi:uncharacterized membrane protein